MNQVLVTGAAGFIASRVAAQLLDQGVGVVAIDNFNDAYDVRLKRHRMESLEGRGGFRLVEGTIESKETVETFMSWQPK